MKLSNVQIRKILYATDLSENAMHAFSYAASLANMYGAGITILHVLTEFPQDDYVSNMITDATWNEIKLRHYSEAREQLIGQKREHVAMQEALQVFSDKVKASAENQDFVTDEVLIKSGTPAEVIVETGKEIGADLIVMGTRGQGAIAAALIGSTAKLVIRNSQIPVLVIRLPKTKS